LQYYLGGDFLMKKGLNIIISFSIVFGMILSACQLIPTKVPAPATETPAAPTETPVLATATPTPIPNAGLEMDSATVQSQFWSDADYEKSRQLMALKPLNLVDPIYLQYLEESSTDISKWPQYSTLAEKLPPYNICFSDARVDDPWRVVAYIDIREQVEQLRADGLVRNFYHMDAQGSDAQQFMDIQNIINTPGKCDILLVAANSNDVLTPIVEKACEVMPVIQFDRFTQTDCPVVSERSIGDYAFGISGAQFIAENLSEGGNVLAFRTMAGVDTLERRWGAARKIFEANPQLNIIGVELSGSDAFNSDIVVSDYITKFGTIDAVWMDSGTKAVTILDSFKNTGAPYPKVISGEDQEDFLQYWKANNLTAIAPAFSSFQWRTAVLSAVMFLQGETVQHLWTLPQPVISAGNLDQYSNTSMPPLHYALCGCEDMTNYPASWQDPSINAYLDVIP
jgi:ribose transport system substrate-binding protein